MFRGESKCNWLGSCEFEALVDPWNLSDTRKNDLKSCCGRSINGRSFNLHGGRDRREAWWSVISAWWMRNVRRCCCYDYMRFSLMNVCCGIFSTGEALLLYTKS